MLVCVPLINTETTQNEDDVETGYSKRGQWQINAKTTRSERETKTPRGLVVLFGA
jgi:hypothetical protein